MKKLLYTFLAVSIVFAACKKEDEEPTNNTNLPSIIGAWTINTLILESNISSDTLSPEDIDFMSNLNFTTNGILYETYTNGEIDTNEWVIIADSLHIGEGGEDFIGKHIVTATHLTLTGPLDENMFGADILIMNGTRD
jgi:hypothetical protein|tara:strand:+ start:85 stop:498 length:414 start_codon:yes stop_codon:yes gene_type:complete